MKIGLLAYSTNTGLGYQTLHFYQNMQPDKVLVADLSRFNGVPTHHERFPGARVADGIPDNSDVEWLVDGMDLVFVCETPLNYHLFKYARLKGVKTVQQYNYEFLDYFRHPDNPPPSVLASPSMWGIERVSKMNIAPVVYWPVPVDTKNIPFRIIREGNTFVHIIGRPAAKDRNGTIAFLRAARQLGKEFNYKVYLQPPAEPRAIQHFEPVRFELEATKAVLGSNLEVLENVENHVEMYTTGDILVLPRKYGGLCLPMWEGLAAGMPVIMTNISPNPTNLPPNWLVEAKLEGTLQAHTEILLYSADEESLANTMQNVIRNIRVENKKANLIAQQMSWERQKPIYKQRFEDILRWY